MSPELFTTYTERHAALTKELYVIEDAFDVVAREIVARTYRAKRKFQETERYINPGFAKYSRVDSIKIDSLDEDHVYVIFTIYGNDGDGDEEVNEIFQTKLFHDYYFDKPAFDQYFKNEYTRVVEKYNSDKLKRDELVKNSEHELFLTLKKKYEGPLT